MENKSLNISLFGGFSMESPNYKLETTANTGNQLALLIACLITNMGCNVSKSTLYDILWPGEDSKDLSGALRTLIYRARKELAKFFPGEDFEYIKFTGDTYYWNSQLDCRVDTALFEQINSKIKDETNPHQKYVLCRQLYELYRGEFLPSYTHIEFVLFRNVYFRNQYVQAVILMCEYLFDTKCYDEIITVCNGAILLYQEDERLYTFEIRAYLALNLPEQAMDYYHTVVNTLSNRFGIEVSPGFSALYRQIIDSLPLKTLDIDHLEEELREPSQEQTSYYCDFYMFKNFYQISKRSVRRSFSKRYLTLFTLVDTNARDLISTDTKTAMAVLFRVISANLRLNDVFTRTSNCQYSIILTVPNENGANVAIKRLKEQFCRANKQPDIQLTIKSKMID